MFHDVDWDAINPGNERRHQAVAHLGHLRGLVCAVDVASGRDRDAAVKQLNDAGVGTGVFYPVPAHQQDYMREIVGVVPLPVAEQLAKEVISLPVHPQLSQADLETIVREVNKL